jgi:hypothetical protein
MALDPPIEHTIDREPDSAVVEHLLKTFPDMWKAWELNRLAPEEFEEFGPVQHFRDSFIAGWNAVQAAIDEQLPAVAVDA